MQDIPAVKEDAVNIAHAALVRKVFNRWPGMLDEEEARQDLALFVLERLPRWEPSKGALSTFVHLLFGDWWKTNIAQRRDRKAMEMPFDPLEMRDGDGCLTIAGRLVAEDSDSAERHAKTELAEVILSLVDDRDRGLVELCYGYGVSRSAAAEITGMRETTVQYRLRKARQIWRESWERGVAA